MKNILKIARAIGKGIIFAVLVPLIIILLPIILLTNFIQDIQNKKAAARLIEKNHLILIICSKSSEWLPVIKRLEDSSLGKYMWKYVREDPDRVEKLSGLFKKQPSEKDEFKLAFLEEISWLDGYDLEGYKNATKGSCLVVGVDSSKKINDLLLSYKGREFDNYYSQELQEHKDKTWILSQSPTPKEEENLTQMLESLVAEHIPGFKLTKS